MIDHLGFGVSDYDRGKAFYAKILAPLGARLIAEVTPEQSEDGVWACGFGRDGKPSFWIGSDGQTSPRMHVAFTAESREAVRRFHEAALEAGATDNGAPGLRPQYGENYFAAFVRDPDGHNIEAVCYGPE